MQPVTLHSLFTDHKLIAVLVVFVTVVFLVSVTKIITSLIRSRKANRMQHEADRHD